VLASYIQQTAGLQLTGVYTNPLEGLDSVKKGETDLVFLDIQMPELSGIDFMKEAKDKCKIILTTAYPEFALEGYEYNVVDYLLKPVSLPRFEKAVSKLPALGTKAEAAGFIFVKSEYKMVRVNFDDITYLRSLRDYVAIHLTNKQKLMTLQTMGSFEKLLPPDLFARIHKSYLVALNKITAVERDKVKIADDFLPIGETYKPEFLRKMKLR
jgi:DNA-binding LytR/AlgR family response regulator